MLTLPKIFSSNAMFLHSSVLDVIGKTDSAENVSVKIIKADTVISEGSGAADANGDFKVRINTPSGSFDAYSIQVSAGEDTLVMENVLFGELWLACGQSNMEMPNHQQPDWLGMFERIREKKIRAFTAPRLAHNAEYPIAPVSDTDGWWACADDEPKMRGVSALATAFSDGLYDFLASRGQEMPVGFLNCSRGGTCIETWIPREVFDRYEKIGYKKPDLENWNQKGEGNYQQPGAHYNFNTHPHLGVKARGMLWYQGETNLVAEQTQHIYKDLLIALRESYKELFAPSKEEIFPLVSSQIYPWKYTNFDESHIGYFNKCFSDLGEAYPTLYPYVPICDLSPVWTYHAGNHPIHPAHKYTLGYRFALLCENIYYGREGKNVQKLAPMLKSCVRHGSALRLTFNNVGSGLYLKNGKIKGMYIRSKDGAYAPAEAEILNKSTMLVWNKSIEKPLHAAYAVSSAETATTLMAGELPVAPFCTEFDKGATTAIIRMKPWLDMSADSEFFIEKTFCDAAKDAGVKPVYYPSDGSNVCYDSVYSLSGRSLKVMGCGKRFGTYILSKHGATLDFENYKTLKISLYNSDEVGVRLKLYYAEKDGASVIYNIEGKVESKLDYGWSRIVFDLQNIPAGFIEKAEFAFEQRIVKVAQVNIDCVELEAAK